MNEGVVGDARHLLHVVRHDQRRVLVTQRDVVVAIDKLESQSGRTSTKIEIRQCGEVA